MSLAVQAQGGPRTRVSDLLRQVDYRLVETETEKEEIYQLRYRAYLNEGAVFPRNDLRLTDRFDELPNSWTFAVHFDGALVSSVRISVASADRPLTPAVDAFPDALQRHLAHGKIIVDPNRFVADPARASRLPELPYVTLRLAYVACEHFNADLGTATVRSEHQAFYKRVFMHDVVCPPRPYPTLIKPLSLMAVDFHAMRDKVFKRYPIFRSTLAERHALFARSLPQHNDSILHLPEPALAHAPTAPHA